MSPRTISAHRSSSLGAHFVHLSMDLQVEEYEPELQHHVLKLYLTYSKNTCAEHKQHLHVLCCMVIIFISVCCAAEKSYTEGTSSFLKELV